MRGKLIVLEGVDGSGTTTQAESLREKLEDMGHRVHRTAQPSQGPVGKMIRDVLQRKVMNEEGPPSFELMSLLFAADRRHQQDREISPTLEKGVHVICDRYLHSSVIYQSVTAGDPGIQEWIKEINRDIIAPDLVLYARIDAQTSKDRRSARGGEEEIFDALDFQQSLIEQYDRIGEIFPEHRLRVLDARLQVEEIGALALEAVMEIIGTEDIP